MKIQTHSSPTLRALWLISALAAIIPSHSPAQPIIPVKIETSSWYVQVGLLVNPSNGLHRFVNPPSGPGLWCTPAEMILNGSESIRARDYPLCPDSAGLPQRTRHDSAPHADDVVPSSPWAFDIARSLPNPGPFAVETRVAGSRPHPGAGHTDLYTAVVGGLLGTVPGPSLAPRFVIIHGSLGKHVTTAPQPGPSPIVGGCHLTPPSGRPSDAGQDYPMGQVTTIVDPAEGKLLLMLVVEGMTNIVNLHVRNGAGGPIVTDLRPLMQTRQLDQYACLFYVPNMPISPAVAQVLASGNAVISVPTANHPDGQIVGTLRVVPTDVFSYDIALRPGWNVIANQLKRGSNTLAEVLPSVPPGSTFYRFDANTQSYSFSTFDPDFGWDNPTLSFAPGEGGFLQNPSASPFTVTFFGETVTPRLPLSPPQNQLYFGASQIPAPATFEEILGYPPVEGTRLYRYDSALQGDAFSLSNWFGYAFSQGQWTPGAPVVGVGEGVLVQVPGIIEPGPTLSIQRQGGNMVVSSSASAILQSMDQLGSSHATRWTRFSNLNPWVVPIEAGAKFFSATARVGWDVNGDGNNDLIKGGNGRLAYAVGGGAFQEIPCDNWHLIDVAGPPAGFDVQCIDPATGTVTNTHHLRDVNGNGVFGAGEVTTTP